jgi:hypothetical protein
MGPLSVTKDIVTKWEKPVHAYDDSSNNNENMCCNLHCHGIYWRCPSVTAFTFPRTPSV